MLALRVLQFRMYPLAEEACRASISPIVGTVLRNGLISVELLREVARS